MRSSLKRILVLTLIVALIPLNVSASEVPVTRLNGADRYATAIEVSKSGWSSASVVIIARGDDYADALAGVPLAYSLGAPILLVFPSRLPVTTRQEIVRLGATRAIILGGTGAVGTDVAAALQALGLAVERIAGDNRFDTATKIAAHLAPNGVSTAVIANGRNFPDALAAAPYAAAAGYPVLLVEPTSVPKAVEHALQGLGVSETIVVGGTGVISSSVYNKLPRPRRISGADRYATAVALAKHFLPQGNRLFIATGRDFADAITGGVLAAREGTGLLLVGKTVPSGVGRYLKDTDTKSVCILGGTGAVSVTVANALMNILVPSGTSGLAGLTVPGATVTVGGRTTVAAADGSYQVAGLAAGKLSAVFSREGYGTKTYSVKIVSGRCSILNADLLGMDPGQISLRGAVIDKATDLPLAGAEVEVETLIAGAWVFTTQGKTDANGVYNFTNSGGEDTFTFGSKVRLTIRKEGYASFQKGYHPVVLNIDLKRDAVGNVAPGVEMVRVKPLNLSGRVTKPDGVAVANELVTLYYGDRYTTARTNAQGDYQFKDLTLPSGKYTILMDYVGNEHAMYSRDINVTEGRDLTHPIKLVAGSKVWVEIKAEKDGELFKEGAEYKAVLLQGGATLAADTAAVTDKGKALAFGWDRIAPGSYTVRISGDYVITKTFSIQVYSSDYSSLNQRVTRAGTIKGTVKVKGSSGVAGVKVELVNTGARTVATAFTDGDGNYCFGGLVSGSKYTLHTSTAGYRTEVSGQQIIVVNEDQVYDFSLTDMPSIASVTGTVRTAGSLIPASGANIAFRALSVLGYGHGAKVKETTVGADGSYGVDLFPGAYTVVISDPGEHETLEAVLTAVAGDVINDRSFRLQPGGKASLTVTVWDSANRGVSKISLTDKWGYTVTRTESKGTESFKNLTAGSYTLTASTKDHEDLIERIDVAKDTAISRSFTMTASNTVRTVGFWVVGENNTSVKDARILVLAGTEKVAEGKTDNRGKIEFRLPAGAYRAMIYANGYLLEGVEFQVGNKNIIVPIIRLEKW